MKLVKFVCQAPSCGRLLGTIDEPLPGWLADVPRQHVVYNVPKCPRHGGTVDGFRRLAVPGRTVSLTFGPLQVRSDPLWSLIDTARRTGKTQTHPV